LGVSAERQLWRGISSGYWFKVKDAPSPTAHRPPEADRPTESRKKEHECVTACGYDQAHQYQLDHRELEQGTS